MFDYHITLGVSLVEKIAVGVGVTLYIIITAVIVLLMVCCFLHWKYSSGEWLVLTSWVEDGHTTTVYLVV